MLRGIATRPDESEVFWRRIYRPECRLLSGLVRAPGEFILEYRAVGEPLD